MNPSDEKLNIRILQTMWRQLHRFAFECTLAPLLLAHRDEFLQAWVIQFPPDCPCHDFWKEHITLFPMPDESDAFFWWTIHTHDCVNKKLGKTVWHPSSLKSAMLTS